VVVHAVMQAWKKDRPDWKMEAKKVTPAAKRLMHFDIELFWFDLRSETPFISH